MGPASTTRPARSTSARSVMRETTARSWLTKSSAMPRSATSASSRARISACTVTSSAVVGSSAISSCGRQASAAAMATRWRWPPEISCGYARAIRSGSGSRTSVERVEHGAAESGAAQPEVPAQRLGDLARRAASAGRARSAAPGRPTDATRPRSGDQVPFARADHLDAVEDRRCRTPSSPAGSSPVTANEVSDLPEPDSPIRLSRSPASTGTRRRRRARRAVAAPSTLEVPCTSRIIATSSCVGSATSRRPSATRLTPITRTTSATPGAIAPTGATATVPCASCSRRPQDAFGGGAPSPRYDRLASASTATPNWSARLTLSVGQMFGQDVPAHDPEPRRCPRSARRSRTAARARAWPALGSAARRRPTSRGRSRGSPCRATRPAPRR